MIVEASNSPSPLANRWSEISNNPDIPRLEYLSIQNEAAPQEGCSLVALLVCENAYCSSARASLMRRMASMMFSSLVA